VPDVFTGERLRRAQDGYLRATEPHRRAFLEEKARGEGIGHEGGLRFKSGSAHYRTFYNAPSLAGRTR
jgi:hypothetical protein